MVLFLQKTNIFLGKKFLNNKLNYHIQKLINQKFQFYDFLK